MAIQVISSYNIIYKLFCLYIEQRIRSWIGTNSLREGPVKFITIKVLSSQDSVVVATDGKNVNISNLILN